MMITILSGMLVLALYQLVLLCVVVCFVRRWKKYMKQKEQELKRCKMELKAALRDWE